MAVPGRSVAGAAIACHGTCAVNPQFAVAVQRPLGIITAGTTLDNSTACSQHFLVRDCFLGLCLHCLCFLRFRDFRLCLLRLRYGRFCRCRFRHHRHCSLRFRFLGFNSFRFLHFRCSRLRNLHKGFFCMLCCKSLNRQHGDCHNNAKYHSQNSFQHDSDLLTIYLLYHTIYFLLFQGQTKESS